MPRPLAKVSPRKRAGYGLARFKLTPLVDVAAPSGDYAQKTSKRREPLSSPTRTATTSPRKSVSPHKRESRYTLQNDRWILVAIPQAIPQYLKLLRVTDNLRNCSNLEAKCDCMPTVHRLRVVCVFQDSIREINICSCSPVTLLVQLGLFPSAPVRPSFAVDIRMLRFIQELYARSPLNLSAWSGALEAMLKVQGFNFQGQDVIRRKMAMAMKWFGFMVAQKEVVVKTFLLEEGRWQQELEGDVIQRLQSAGVEENLTDDEEGWVDEVDEESDDQRGGRTFVEKEALDSPSQYLQDRCPLCFNKDRLCRNFSVEAIVCLDANFTQKRRAPARGEDRGPPLTHPSSVFLTRDEVKTAEAYVNRLRPPSGRGGNDVEKNDRPDQLEPGMKIPNSVLDGCNQSFAAADEKRMKASTRLFSDTGLMGLLCRHDRVLWLVNMTSGGERQYYAIALLQKLFDNIPEDMTVGVLYDIACQLHRSCVKWGFLADYQDRIQWSVSVFHAYGHQWPCQLVYHPRKREGFGLSDGEGCERFWAAIKILIPALRVSGYHQRLFAIDAQVAYLDEKSLEGVGDWLRRKWVQCQARSRESEEALKKTKLTGAMLERQWQEQIRVQTAPLANVSKAPAKRVIKEILGLTTLRDGYKAELDKVNRQLTVLKATPDMDIDDLTALSLDLAAKLAQTEDTIANHRRRLGVEDQQNLKRLVNSKFLSLRLNAAALKERIQAKLRARKFELERLDKAARNPASSDNKLQAHIQAQVARHQPNIIKLVSRYNTICSDMETLIAQRRAPRGAIAPRRIDRDTLFSLDVDDPIWDTRGLDDDHSNDGAEPPAWLADEDTISGIRALLMSQRCSEESLRIVAEAQHLQAWSHSSWNALVSGLGNQQNADLLFEYQGRQNRLLDCIRVWSNALVDIPGVAEGGWGPTESELRNRALARASTEISFLSSTSAGSSQWLDSDYDDGDDDWEIRSEGEGDLLEVVDEVYSGELYLGEDKDPEQEIFGVGYEGGPSATITGSPRKRARPLEDDL
ncbi:hypothetical protein CC1G_15624 [Coprinopsis cinerea okayama7|uniref:Uncharacterized protein n=1 Tax=Coprinopsis cinerea (strain Okayama-7 / 130 / ATCC MYA-4618 / FGSC 9003) TaxID=240176 RepID=D6RNF4_COPC7|nr:hypothetical protein CC1G_15624 [Coprinopsis cinerea okayama7\|eukprot:XP_002911082.1 hypothetical protein CC1G_15624 [Coprinopsis cinerea okayama7\